MKWLVLGFVLLCIALLLTGCSTPCNQHWRCFGAACGGSCARLPVDLN